MTAAMNLVGLLANITLKLTELSFRLLYVLVSWLTRGISSLVAVRRANPDIKRPVARQPKRRNRLTKRGRRWQKRRH